MRRLVLCLPVIFLCFLTGCFTEETLGNIKKESGEVVLLWDDKEETYDWVDRIGKKIEITEMGLSGNRERICETIKKADIVIAGAYGNKEDWEKILDIVTGFEEIQGKRFSFFLIQEKGTDSMEWEYVKKEKGAEVVMLPGIILEEKPEYLEEELSRIDGWLTTVFTFQKEEKTGS